MHRISLLIALFALFPATSFAERIDGPLDGSLETLIERALPIVQTKYLHPDAVEPAEMTIEGVQSLENAAPSIVVTRLDAGRHLSSGLRDQRRHHPRRRRRATERDRRVGRRGPHDEPGP